MQRCKDSQRCAALQGGVRKGAASLGSRAGSAGAWRDRCRAQDRASSSPVQSKGNGRNTGRGVKCKHICVDGPHLCGWSTLYLLAEPTEEPPLLRAAMAAGVSCGVLHQGEGAHVFSRRGWWAAVWAPIHVSLDPCYYRKGNICICGVVSPLLCTYGQVRQHWR